MGGARGMHKGEEQCIQGNQKARYRLEDLGVLGVQYGYKWGRVGWSHLSEDREKWWAVVNTVMNMDVP